MQGSVSYVTAPDNEGKEFFPIVTVEVGDDSRIFSASLDALLDSDNPISFVKETCTSRSYVVRGDDRKGFSGINGSALNIYGYVEARIIFHNVKHNVVLRVVS